MWKVVSSSLQYLTLQSNDNTDSLKSQAKADTIEQELSEKFTPKKSTSLLLSQSYRRLGYDSRSDRVYDCAAYLEFLKLDAPVEVSPRVLAPPDDFHGAQVQTSYKLYHANFCKDRLCPMCAWRRSYKIYGQVSRIMTYLGDKYRYIFLTLTVPNCQPAQLNGKITDMMHGWHRLVKYKRFESAVLGFYRALEITRNKKNGTYHPHFHVVLAVAPSYFHKFDYIQQSEWLNLWRRAMKDNTITQVDVRVMRDKKTGCTSGVALASAVAESAKYAVKSSDYIFADPRLTDSIVAILADALFHRRLTAYGGVFADAYKELGLDDPEDGDLVHLDQEAIREDIATMILRYKWSAGAYKLIEKENFENDC